LSPLIFTLSECDALLLRLHEQKARGRGALSGRSDSKVAKDGTLRVRAESGVRKAARDLPIPGKTEEAKRATYVAPSPRRLRAAHSWPLAGPGRAGRRNYSGGKEPRSSGSGAMGETG